MANTRSQQKKEVLPVREVRNISQLKQYHITEIKGLKKKINSLRTKVRSQNHEKMKYSWIEKERERLQKVNGQLITENDVLKKDLIEKNEKIFMHETDIEHWKSMKDNETMVKIIEDERAIANEQRRRALECQAAMIKGQEDLEKQTKVWKFCEICSEEYGFAEKRTPRVLKCGHTVCHECLTNFVNPFHFVRCPFDMKAMSVKNIDLNDIPKNFLVLNM